MTWTPLKLAAAGLELGLVLAGLRLLWTLVLSPEARAEKKPAQLGAWNAHVSEWALFLLHALFGGFAGGVATGLLAKLLPLTTDGLTLVSTAGMHLGILAGIVVFHALHPRILDAKFGPAKDAFLSGIATFLIAMPLIIVTGLVWMGLLSLAGIEVQQQPAVALFTRLKSPVWILFMIVTAGILAPITEELGFRLGLFRFLRTRVSRWIGLLIPALLFAASHADLNTFGQLAALGIVFSLAYERTGMIGTTMVAHALFNLNSVLLLLAGVAV